VWGGRGDRRGERQGEGERGREGERETGREGERERGRDGETEGSAEDLEAQQLNQNSHWVVDLVDELVLEELL
jgi:hypothetical protein